MLNDISHLMGVSKMCAICYRILRRKILLKLLHNPLALQYQTFFLQNVATKVVAGRWMGG